MLRWRLRIHSCRIRRTSRDLFSLTDLNAISNLPCRLSQSAGWELPSECGGEDGVHGGVCVEGERVWWQAGLVGGQWLCVLFRMQEEFKGAGRSNGFLHLC